MKVNGFAVKMLLTGMLSVLSLGMGVSGVREVASKYAGVPVLPARATEQSAAQVDKSREEYCRAGTFLGRYYRNYYSGNADSREFFYFQRDWLSVCSK